MSPTMTLNELCRLLQSETPVDRDVLVTSITEDSRRVVPGTVFVATAGEHVDGHLFAAHAVVAGAVAILGDRPGLRQLYGAPYVRVPQPRKAAGIVAHALAGYPSRGMTVIGVTGTNGKSSTVLLTQRILETCGYSAAAFGTLGYDIGGQRIPAVHTTPFGEDLAEMFAKARDHGHTHVVMEVSSHALDQERVAGVDFDVAVFTNLTQDHLDYHKDMEAYCRAKLLLFERLEGPGRFTVVNADDPSAGRFLAASKVPCCRVSVAGAHSKGRLESLAHSAEYCGAEVRMNASSMRFVAHTPWGSVDVETPLLGTHNVYNALCAIAVCGGLGLPLDGIAEGIASLKSVPGRFERVEAGQDFLVIVDYAHTPDGLRNVLLAAREICRGRVIVVFGCGGDRDKTKRPKMAEAAAELADFTIITSDNPRTESPERILLDIEVGMQRSGGKKYDDYETLPDRAEAIRRALSLAKTGDLVLIAGKGHETYQIVGTNRIPFDDRQVARTILEER